MSVCVCVCVCVRTYMYVCVCVDQCTSPPSQHPSSQRVTLSGYGVELAVKSTEYKAVDDTEVKGQPHPSLWFCG